MTFDETWGCRNDKNEEDPVYVEIRGEASAKAVCGFVVRIHFLCVGQFIFVFVSYASSFLLRHVPRV